MSSESLIKYIAIRGLRISPLNTADSNFLYQLGSPMGFLFLEGSEIVWFGLFDQEPPKEVVFRLKLLLQSLHNARQTFENETVRTLTPEKIAYYRNSWERFRVVVFVSREIDKNKIQTRVSELTEGLDRVPWIFINEEDVQTVIQREYDIIGEF